MSLKIASISASGSTSYTIGGLPYNPSGTTYRIAGGNVMVNKVTNPSKSLSLIPYINGNTNKIYFYWQKGANLNWSALTASEIGTSATMYLSITYDTL